MPYAVNFHIIPGCYYEARVAPPVNGDTYQWSEDGLNYTSPSTTNYYIPAGSSGYVARNGANDPVWAIVHSGCVAGGAKTLQGNFTVQAPPNTPGLQCMYRLAPKGNAFTEVREIQVMPNPTNDSWQVQFPEDAENFSAQLTNASGQLL